MLTPAALAAPLFASSMRSRSARLMRTFPFASVRAVVRGGFSAVARAAVLVAANASSAPTIIERPQEIVPCRAASRFRRSPARRTTQ